MDSASMLKELDTDDEFLGGQAPNKRTVELYYCRSSPPFLVTNRVSHLLPPKIFTVGWE